MIFVIGTGPTLADIDLAKLNGQTTIAINDITKELHYFKPTYWMFADSGFYRKYMKEIRDAQMDGVKLVTTASMSGVEQITIFGDRGKLRKGEIEFYDKPRANVHIYSVGATGYAALQWAWQKGFRKMYVIGFDGRHPYPHNNYRDDYMERVTSRRMDGYMPKDIWGKAYDKANEWIWENGGEIWDVSHSQCGSFQYKDLDEVLSG